MPIYEYRCQTCGKQSSVFFRSYSAVKQPQCPHCESREMGRMVSRVNVLKPWGQSLDWMPSTESLYDVDEDDPEAMEGWLRGVRGMEGGELTDSFADTLTRMDAGIEPPMFSEPGDSGEGEE